MNTDNPLSATVPTHKQLHDMKFKATRKEQLSGNFFIFSFFVMYQPTLGDAVANISLKYPNFVRGVSLHPDVHIVLVSDFRLELMSEPDTVIFVDGTFCTTECGLILTILMVLRGKKAIPVAFCLSSA